MTYFLSLKTVLLLGIFTCFLRPSLAQLPRFGNSMTVPVYRSKEDSVKGGELNKLLQETMFSKDKKKGNWLDSVFRKREEFMKHAVIGYRTIYFSSKGYVTLDSLKKLEVFEDVTQVSLERITSLPEQLWRCTNLQVLEVVNSSLDKLPDLSSLSKLKNVKIYNNKSKRVFKISPNTKITDLTIRTEQPKRLPRSYKQLPELVRLDLQENQLTKFPNGARKNKKLLELSVQYNKLTLKGKIKSHPYLQQLALQNNKIEVVPESIRKFPNLKKLNFNSNNVSRVDNAIQNLQKLEFLSFYKNNLAAIPEGVYKLSALKEIDLFHNQIEKLEPEKSNWQNLTTLYLSHNKVLELPESISLFKSLEGLYVWDNRIGKLPESIGLLQKLKFVRVNNNYLKVIPESLLQLHALEEFDCARNFITHFHPQLFEFKNLRIIAFNNNPWDEESKKVIASNLESLRSRDVYVHADE